jgi:hypothetical protein
MTKTEYFFWKSSAQKYADDLKACGIYEPSVYPARTWGPRDCFHVLFSGWQVVWTELN